MVLPLAVSLFALRGLEAGGAGTGPQAAGTATVHLLVALAVVAGAALLGGRIAELLRQPPVIGEISAGIMLGPSLLGRIAPDVQHWLFSPAVLPMLDGLAQIGVVLFMFQVGRELGATRLSGAAVRTPLIGAASVLSPFAAGVLLATAGPARNHVGSAANPMAYAIFLGCVLSVTALPVLARILADLGLTGTRIAQVSLLAAALGDGAAWLLLSLALAIASGGSPEHTLRAVLLAVAVTLLLVGTVPWGLRRMTRRLAAKPAGPTACDQPDESWRRWSVLLVVFVGASAALTAAVGVHEIIGALLAGLAVPRGHRPLELATARLADTGQVLLPVFFAGIGLSIDLGTLPLSADTLALCGLLLATAMATKFLGSGLAGRCAGLGWREAAGLGSLLNARGLTGLVVIGAGFQAGIIDHQMVAVLVIVTLVTTALAGPLVRALGFARTTPSRVQQPLGRAHL